MLSIKRILCPTDFSEPSGHAVATAGELALQFGAEICVIHVLPVVGLPPSDPNFVLSVPEYERLLHNDADEKLQAVARDLRSRQVRVTTRVANGHAGHEIVRVAREENFDLIVIATQGQSRLEHVLFGSVAERVVRLADRPVLSIPTRKH
jgi:nucleotide-binding universal stress UspA family protein